MLPTQELFTQQQEYLNLPPINQYAQG